MVMIKAMLQLIKKSQGLLLNFWSKYFPKNKAATNGPTNQPEMLKVSSIPFCQINFLF